MFHLDARKIMMLKSKCIVLVGYLFFISTFTPNIIEKSSESPLSACNYLGMDRQSDGSTINGDYIPSYALWTHLSVGENRLFLFPGNNSVQIQQIRGMNFRYDIDTTVENTTILLDIEQYSFLNTSIQISTSNFQSPPHLTTDYEYSGKLIWNIPQLFRFTFNKTQISGYIQFDLNLISDVQTILSKYSRNHLVPIIIDEDGNAEILDFSTENDAIINIPLNQFTQFSFQIAILTFDFEIHTIPDTDEPEWPQNLVLIVITIGIFVVIIVSVISSDYFQHYVVRYISPNLSHHRLNIPQIFDNQNRQKIIEILISNPGIHFNELKRITDLSAGQLSWHLDLLESYGLISSKRIGQYVTYFVILKEKPINEIDLTLMKSPTTKLIFDELTKTPGIHANTLAQRFNLTRATVKYHIDKLQELNYIRSVKIGRKIELYPIIFPSGEIKE